MTTQIPVIEKITKANDRIADRNRILLDENRVAGMNLMAAPGAGKTTLIERTVSRLSGEFRVGVVEGDLATSLDAERASAAGAVAVQVNTGTCHLDASMVGQALESLPLSGLDLILVENVGNLICPAGFALGTHHNVIVGSVTEGDDKPFKYPRIYRGTDVLVINKIDLLPYVDFDMARFIRGVEALNEHVLTFPMSCRTGEGMDAWLDWVRGRVAAFGNG